MLGLAGLLLDYPDEAMLGLRAEYLAAAKDLPDSPAARRIVAFCTWLADQDADEVARAYVATFDHKRCNALYVTYAANGDMRRRGEALLAFKALYTGAGLRPREDELPDYLPTVCRFAALAGDADADAALGWARTGVDLVARSLASSGSPWAGLLEAVRACLPPPGRTDGGPGLDALIAAGPPSELVGAY
ncbi:MAG: nitrate reductase molybdenum cofactor assembly chaperone [Actinomycetia bacterium]|nr:nitrate reductase molybdenum cofactor assembly chaperone [Actinomycetes bacterium]